METAPIVAVLLLATTTSWAQDVRKDSVWNGVVVGAGVGAGIGAAAGLVMAETDADICSVGTCMALAAVAGSAIGLLVDKSLGRARAVEPGAPVDDRLWDGALLGAGVASAVALIDFSRICRTPRGCTAEGVLDAALRGALFGAAIGALVDAAIPSRAPGATTGGRLRRPSLVFSVSF